MLSNRNRVRLRHWGRMLGGRRRQCPCPQGDCLPLNAIPEGTQVIITRNQHLPTIERGICQGVQVTMFRNDSSQPNVIVAVGDARYVLDRRIAREIRGRVI